MDEQDRHDLKGFARFFLGIYFPIRGYSVTWHLLQHERFRAGEWVSGRSFEEYIAGLGYKSNCFRSLKELEAFGVVHIRIQVLKIEGERVENKLYRLREGVVDGVESALAKLIESFGKASLEKTERL